MKPSQDIYHPLVPAIMGYAREKGIHEEIAPHELAWNIQPDDLANSRLTQDQLQQLGADISDEADGPCPGLHIGENLNWANVGIVGYIVVNSLNVMEGLKKFRAYYQMVSNITRFKLVTRPDTIELCWQLLDTRLKKHHQLILEGILGSMGPLLEQQTGFSITPKETQFCWPAPGDLSEYERVFGSRLSFNESCIKAVYDRSVGDLPCRFPNAELRGVLENYVKERCYRQQADKPRSGEVLKLLKARSGEILRIDQVADLLGTSVRTLQIRLKKEGATFRGLRDQALCDRSRLLLVNSPESMEAISSRLGFSEPAVFYRNFKRWTGQTPGEFRSTSLA